VFARDVLVLQRDVDLGGPTEYSSSAEADVLAGVIPLVEG
jgi:hypothetical protein